MNVGERIREHREASGMLQEDLAKACYVSRQTISNWERNKTLPDIESLKTIAATFGTTVDALIGDDAPEIAQRFDREARELLGLEATYYLIFFVTMGYTWATTGVTLEPGWQDLEFAVLFFLFGAMLALGVISWLKRRKRGLKTFEEVSDYLADHAIIENTKAARIARWMLKHPHISYSLTLSSVVLISYFGGGALRGYIDMRFGAVLLLIFLFGIPLQLMYDHYQQKERQEDKTAASAKNA